MEEVKHNERNSVHHILPQLLRPVFWLEGTQHLEGREGGREGKGGGKGERRKKVSYFSMTY